MSRPARAIVFVDGANLHHKLKELGVWARDVDVYKVARKLIMARELVELRYYIGEVRRDSPERVAQSQRELIANLETHPEVEVRLGHIQQIPTTNACADEILSFLARLTERLPGTVYQDLIRLARKHQAGFIYREKGVDVHLACDLVRLAQLSRYDVAYLVSGDADFVPAVEIVRGFGKRVFVASPDAAARLIDAADVAIKLGASWFADCLNEKPVARGGAR